MANFIVKFQTISEAMIVISADTEEEVKELVIKNSNGEIGIDEWEERTSHYTGNSSRVEVIGIQPLNI